ncbi:MAG: c-type cytochrome [Deltaproteobacteria bacterium]|nr:c-type cytochrome [Deltaproteobacteria bacterium]
MIGAAAALLLLVLLAPPAAGAPAPPQPPVPGKTIYETRCGFCHGDAGRGDGPVADYLDPRPRDFTGGIYKLTSTQSGQAPTDDDLFRTVTQGIPGTAMPAWGSVLPEAQRRQVIAYIKTFAPEAFATAPERITVGTEVSASSDTIRKGKELYQKAKCWECHGQWGARVRPANLARGWRYRGGSSARDVFTRLSAGMNGTPMPSYVDTFNEEQRWQLAHYVRSLVREPKERGAVVLRVRGSEAIPLDPDDRRWAGLEPLEVPLSGQVITRPRWQTPAVDMIFVRAFFTDKEIGFHLEWDDPFKDTRHDEPSLPPGDGKGPYVKLDLSKAGRPVLRDAVALQFPVTLPSGPELPHFFLGDRLRPVNLWHWMADRQGDSPGTTPVVELNAMGYQVPPQPQTAEGQQVRGKGTWKDGRWRVVMVRPLTTPDRGKDIMFEPGRFIPVAFHVWDGSHGEAGLRMALSSWYYLLLEPPTPPQLYLYPLVAMLGAGGFELWLVRRARRDRLATAAAGARPGEGARST